MAMLIKQKVSLTKCYCPKQAFYDGEYTCDFFFSIVDSSLVGQPRQGSATTYHQVKVTITWEVFVNWGLEQKDLPKLLFWFAKERIEENMSSGNVPKNDELTLTSQTAENKCPFDI